MIDSMNISCYITAGGKARRMNGRHKAFIEIDGERIIDKNLKIYKSLFSEIGIITNNPDLFVAYNIEGIRLISDKYKNIGPLAGIHASIFYTSADYIFIAASDMPNVSAELITIMLDKVTNTDAVIPIHNGKIEPLFAIYNSDILMKLESFIEQGNTYAIRDFLLLLDVTYFEVSEQILTQNPFLNINYESDL